MVYVGTKPSGKRGYEVKEYNTAEYNTGEYDVLEYNSVYEYPAQHWFCIYKGL